MVNFALVRSSKRSSLLPPDQARYPGSYNQSADGVWYRIPHRSHLSDHGEQLAPYLEKTLALIFLDDISSGQASH
jgi:hypothetical protein